MKKLEEIFVRLGLDKTNGLYITKEKLWEKETAFPNRVKTLIKQKIEPAAFFCFDNKPLILFFLNPSNKQELHKAIWNFNECPIAIIIAKGIVEIFNGFSLNKDTKLLKYIGGEEKLNDFNYFELVTGKTWEQYTDQLNYKNRVDYHLLENIKAARKLLVEKHKLDAKIINAIIGKSIFVRYLIDRKVNIKFDENLRTWSNDEFCELLNQPRKVQKFFDYLEDKERGFNGNLFPLTANEYKQISKEEYWVIRRLLQGEEIDDGQFSLFQLYDFSIIPIEFISNIYELFIGQENQKKAGAYYTPLFLVDYILKETVEKKLNSKGTDYNCIVLDPACGSGIFLVETLRKIIEKYITDTGVKIKSENFKEAIKKLAKENIYGIDKDLSAVQVAIFSVYLTLLDYLKPREIETFKFPVLLNSNFFEADIFDENSSFNNQLKDIEFDFILGNPPWAGKAIGEVGELYLRQRKTREKSKGKKYPIAINNGEIAEGFIFRVSDFATAKTQIALIVKSSILYNKGYSEFSKFRQYWLEEFFIDKVFELAPVRHQVFDKSNDPAIAPAAIIFYRFADGLNTNKNTIEHLALKPSRFFSLFKIFTLNRTDVKKVEQIKLKEYDWLWKILVYGSYLDFNFIKRLYEEYQSVNNFISNKNRFKRGTGVQYSNTPKEDSKHLIGLPFIDVFGIEPFFINPKKITSFDKVKVGRRRDPELFKSPILLTRIGLDTNCFTAKAAITYNDMVYKKSVTGIKPLNPNDISSLRNILGLVNSSLYSYLAINSFASIGIEREQTKEYEKFNIPYFDSGIAQFVKTIEGIKNEIHIEEIKPFRDNIKIGNLHQLVSNNLQKIDAEIFKLIETNDIEFELIDYALGVTRYLIVGVENTSKNIFSSLSINDKFLRDYATLFIKRFRNKLDTNEKKFIVEIWYSNQIIGMFFKMVDIKEYKQEITWINKQSNAEFLSFLLKIGTEKITERLFVQKDIRGFDNNGNDFFIIKPNEKRLWHKAIGYLDVNEFADAILRGGMKGK